MKDLDLKQIPAKLRTAFGRMQKYTNFIFIIAILLVYTFLVLRIGMLTQAEPDEDAVGEKLKTVKRLKIDQNSAEKLEELEDQNVGVQSLFKEARDNPFEE